MMKVMYVWMDDICENAHGWMLVVCVGSGRNYCVCWSYVFAVLCWFLMFLFFFYDVSDWMVFEWVFVRIMDFNWWFWSYGWFECCKGADIERCLGGTFWRGVFSLWIRFFFFVAVALGRVVAPYAFEACSVVWQKKTHFKPIDRLIDWFNRLWNFLSRFFTWSTWLNRHK